METALASFLTSIGFSFVEILKMLVLVGMNFTFILLLAWRIKKPLISFYHMLTAALSSVPEMRESLDRLNSSLQEHIVQTDLRMTEGDENYRALKNEIEKLKSQIGVH